MSWELYYTSAERGLKPHSRGFCTVARTEGMPPPVVERLESLSSYRPAFSGGSADAERNPIAWAHWRIPVGPRNRSVLSRVAYVGSDYTGRPSSFAHHVLLEPAEQLPIGPAAMLMLPGMMETAWSGEPMLLPPRIPPNDEVAAAPTPVSSVTGWASRLAEAYRADPEKPAYLVYPAGMELLPVLNTAIGLLPPALRWQVTFATHFTELPAGLTCTWRCVIAGTPAAAALRRAPGMAIDLTRPEEGA